MFVVMAGSAAAGPPSSGKTPVIGLLDAGERLDWWTAFKQQLRDLGYIEGQNIAFEARYAAGNNARLPALANELAQRHVRVIVTGGSVATQAALGATRTIPIVTATGDSPVAAGIASSLGRPGGTVTGVTSISDDLDNKRLELLRDVLPKLSRLALLWR
jgi:ABC-type uncharacterized transport system substrate-binding protein